MMYSCPAHMVLHTPHSLQVSSFRTWSFQMLQVRQEIQSVIVLSSEQKGLPCGSAGKETACNAGDLGLIPGLRRSPGERKGYPLQYSGLENSMDCTVHGVPWTQSQTQLNDFQIKSNSSVEKRKWTRTQDSELTILSLRVIYY